MAVFRVSLPGWLVNLVLSAAAYLRGRERQAADDAAKAEQVTREDEAAARRERAAAEAMDHDELTRETDRWSKSS